MEKSKKRKVPRKETKQEKEEEKKIDEAEAVTEVPKVIIPAGWTPRTSLGKKVAEGSITDIDEIFKEGIKIGEPQIIEILLPNLENEIILAGGTAGKGGGIRRTPFRRTTRMHKSGRRYKISVMTTVGNKNGYVGIGYSSGPPGKHRDVIEKSLNKARLHVIPIRRGCGSWECNCMTQHSLPFIVRGKSGSVRVELIPAPKGVGLTVSDEVKKVMRLAGISDIWMKSRGQTSTRINLIRAVFNALKKLNRFKINPEYEKNVGLKVGRI